MDRNVRRYIVCLKTRSSPVGWIGEVIPEALRVRNNMPILARSTNTKKSVRINDNYLIFISTKCCKASPRLESLVEVTFTFISVVFVLKTGT